MFIGIKDNSEYSLLILFTSFLTKFVLVNTDGDKIGSPELVEILTFVFFGLTYYYHSIMFACAYVGCLIIGVLYSSKYLINNFNEYIDYYSETLMPSNYLENTDFNKYLAIWIVIKSWYFFHNTFDGTELFIPAFHYVMGVVFLTNCVNNILNVNFNVFNVFVESPVNYVSFVTFIFLMLLLFVTNFSLILKTVTFISFFIYTYFYEKELPKNLSLLLFVIDSIFMYLLTKNLIKY